MTLSGLESLLTGRTLCDRYEIGPVIGRGGMGVVYRGMDLRLQRPVAVKVLSLDLPDRRAETMLRARLAREGRIAAGIRHPNVVAVFDQGTDPTLQLDFLVMELLEGEDLAKRVRRVGYPSLESAIRIFRSAAAGLEAGHRAGLVHRDVKPANLFLESGARSGEATLKVLDFGIAQAAPDADMTMTVAGDVPAPLSPAFASLEQLSGAPRLTPASDVFSLGAVAYYLIQGNRAFRSTTPDEAKAEVASALGALRLDTRIPLPLVAILERCLASEPTARYADAGELLHALNRFRPTGPGAELDERTIALPGAELPRVARGAVPGAPPASGAEIARRPSRLVRIIERSLPGLLAASFASGLAGLASGSNGLTLISVTATTFILPWLLHHRRGRGSARFAIVATAVVTALGLALLQGDLSEAGAFFFLTIVQLSMAAAASWLSSAPPALPPEPDDTPSSNAQGQW